MLKADLRPWKETLGVGIFLIILFATGFWIFKGVPLWNAIGSAAGFVFFLSCISRFRELRRLQRAEQRRQAAATGSWPIPLASPQPTPDPAALPLPFTISNEPGWLGWLFAPVAMWIVLMFVLICFWLYIGSFVGVLILSGASALLLGLACLLYSYQWIEVSDESLTIRTLFRRQNIRWQEARLFAIDAAAETTAEPHEYELSSATTILRWSRSLKPSRLTRFPNSFQEYSRQMDGLLSIITGKTGLPLYDLRDWVWQPLPASQHPLLPQS